MKKPNTGHQTTPALKPVSFEDNSSGINFPALSMLSGIQPEASRKKNYPAIL